MNKENQSFAKVLGSKEVLALAFGAMIGWGWIVLTGDWIISAGSYGAIIAMAIGSVIIIFGYTDLMVDGAPSPHQSDTTLRWLIDRLRS